MQRVRRDGGGDGKGVGDLYIHLLDSCVANPSSDGSRVESTGAGVK